MRTITIKHEGTEKSYPFRLSYRALKNALRLANLGIEAMAEMDLEHVEIFAAEAVNNGYKFEGSETRIKREDVEGWFDDDFSNLRSVNEAIAEEMAILTEPTGAETDNTVGK